jgi:hypothetical protein
VHKRTYSQYVNEFVKLFPRAKRYRVYVRLMKHVKILDLNVCWEYTGSVNNHGYGKLSWAEKGLYYAHQVSYVLFRGNIPKRHGKKKLCVLHSCDNPKCCNPTHLWLGTHKDNTQDMMAKGRDNIRGRKNK